MRLDRNHGSPYDRGSADSYYGRPFSPHYFVGATYNSTKVDESEMTDAEVAEYTKGFEDNEKSCNFKDWY